jgi:hypothetical protein
LRGVLNAAKPSGPGSDIEELLKVVPGDEALSADFEVGQVLASHFALDQVAGQAGQAGGLADGAG